MFFFRFSSMMKGTRLTNRQKAIKQKKQVFKLLEKIKTRCFCQGKSGGKGRGGVKEIPLHLGGGWGRWGLGEDLTVRRLLECKNVHIILDAGTILKFCLAVLLVQIVQYH